MKIVGIIAEFNPMHTGHKYLIDEAKKITGADTVICIMSGNFTQAGNISLVDKFKRAKVAIEHGIDAVIEIPTIFATASSEYFAFGTVNILNSLNCIDYLCFGSETANVAELQNIAKKIVVNNDNIWEDIKENLKMGISFAAARQQTISKYLSQEELEISSLPNNILAIEYLKSLIKLNSNIVPIAIKRKENDNIVSATKIRSMLEENDTKANQYLFNSDYIAKNATFNSELFNYLKYNVILNGKEKIKEMSEVTEGLENRIYDEINNSKSYDEFIHNIKSKRYQLSKIKRIMIHILLNITKEDFLELNSDVNLYAHIIAISKEKKTSILSAISNSSNIAIITSLNDNIIAKQNDIVKKSLLLDIKASNVYTVFSGDKINKDYTNRI